jgi:hypothetical protein
MSVEFVLWGRPRGSSDALDEKVLAARGDLASIELVKSVAAGREGWHSFRVQRLDLSEPLDWEKAVRGTLR